MTRTFKIAKRTRIYEDPFTCFDRLDVEYEGNTQVWPSVVRCPFVAVVPLSDKGRTALIRQHRFATNQEVWEFCAGGVEDGETVEQNARRELAEELDLHPDRMEQLGPVSIAPSVIDSHGTVFLAHVDDAAFDHMNPSLTEDQITARRVLTLDELDKMIDNGEIICGMTLAAYGLLRRYLDRKGR